MAQAHKRATAKHDLIGHYVYLAENADMETADRFLLEADASFTDLARNPKMGAALPLNRPELAGMVTRVLQPWAFRSPSRATFRRCKSRCAACVEAGLSVV